MICAFSVFTHLLHHESYLYIEDACRALKPKGKLIFSFLEFADPGHWRVFEDTVEAQRSAVPTHLNSFIERSAISVWASHLGDRVLEGKRSGSRRQGIGASRCHPDPTLTKPHCRRRKKDLRAAIATLRDMVRVTGDHETSHAAWCALGGGSPAVSL